VVPASHGSVECKIYNPAFDVTEHSLISAIITEYGIIRESYQKTIKTLIGDK
jgi:methylthioribose-1-phosphate isomerase